MDQDSDSEDDFKEEKEEEESENESIAEGDGSDSDDEVELLPRRPKVVSRKQEESPAQSSRTRIIHAPSKPPPSHRISQTLLDFMTDLQDPSKNDRDWFAVHKNIYDYIQANWLQFTEVCMDAMIERVDDTVAWIPPKELVERIYRDVRFSNDKTPYKKHLSWCMSRNGKKGRFSKYYLSIMGNNQSGLYMGVHEPSKEDLDALRRSILDRTEQGKALISLVSRSAS